MTYDGCRKETYKDGKLVEVVDTRTLEGEKEKILGELKKSVARKLLETDWMVIRESEDSANSKMNAEIKASRKTLRDLSNSIETDLNSMTTLEDLDSYKGMDQFYALI